MSSEASPEVTIIRTYIDWLLNLPWYEGTRARYQLDKVKEALNESHYGLDAAKKELLNLSL